MHRLPHLEHHVIRDIDDVVHGADTGGLEAVRQPGGGGSHLHVEHLRTVARTQIRVPQIYFDDNVACREGNSRRSDLQRGVPDHGGFPRHPEMVQAVRAVGRNLEVDHSRGLGLDGCHLEATQPELRRDRGDVARDLNELRQPLVHDSHGRNCSRKRRSFS